MKSIPLTLGKVALVDDDDYEILKYYSWHAKPDGRTFYAVRGEYRSGKVHSISMHRQIMNLPDGTRVDHINNDGLDNQKHNLRPSTHSQNKVNCPPYRTNTSGYKGVSWHKHSKYWQARISIDGVRIPLGAYKTPEDAARAYDEKAKEVYGEFAQLNFP